MLNEHITEPTDLPKVIQVKWRQKSVNIVAVIVVVFLVVAAAAGWYEDKTIGRKDTAL